MNTTKDPYTNQLVTCHECGQVDKTRWSSDLNKELVDKQLCFNCHFWLEKVGWALNDNKTPQGAQALRVKGSHYVSNGMCSGGPSAFRGYGGSLFYFMLHTDLNTVHTTNNMWHQGDVPKHFEGRLPDNASFITQCPFCGKMPTAFRDLLSLREHVISQLCQTCQDEFFGR